MIKLRKLSHADQAVLVEQMNKPKITRYLSSKIPAPYSCEDALWFIEQGSKQDCIVRAIEVNGVFAGVVGAYLQTGEYAHAAELGYWIVESFWGRGVATAAVLKFTDYLFTTTELFRLYNPVSKPNLASIRVMEKSGFKLEGEMERAVFQDGKYLNELHYAIFSLKEGGSMFS